MDVCSDLRVLDLTRILGGPYATMLLADLGADVVKVEPPGGDPVRRTPPFYADSESEPYGGYFMSINRGKRSIELDLTTDTDQELFLSLVETADVVVENFQTGTMERFGLEYERLKELNPGLIYASIRGFGDPRTVPTDRQGDPVYDIVVQALSGVMQINGQPDDPPTKFGIGIGDLFAGVMCTVGVLAALHQRDQTGEGQYVDISMYDCMVSLCERTIYQYSYEGTVPARYGNAHPLLFPYDAFETKDGLVVIGVISGAQWTTLCEVMGLPELGAAYADQEHRNANREMLREIIAEWTRRRTSEEVLAALEGEIPCAPVQDVTDVFADPVVRERGMLVEVDQPGVDVPLTIAGNPIKMTGSAVGVRGRAPLLDEHREELLATLQLRADVASTGTGKR
ncbi:CoA transferase [Halorarius litoreus]|uniref:CoA transferase n=1 Tax=Halorarius litoreus TaxID=2962676 RepID=UPI0020CFC9BF|nr:CoA transferase [Halorarius litoreus]